MYYCGSVLAICGRPFEGHECFGTVTYGDISHGGRPIGRLIVLMPGTELRAESWELAGVSHVYNLEATPEEITGDMKSFTLGPFQLQKAVKCTRDAAIVETQQQ